MQPKTKSLFYWQMTFVLFTAMFLSARAGLTSFSSDVSWLETARTGTIEVFGVLGALVTLCALAFDIVVGVSLIFKRSDLPPVVSWLLMGTVFGGLLASSPYFHQHVLDTGWEPDLPTLGIAAGAAILMIVIVKIFPNAKAKA